MDRKPRWEHAAPLAWLLLVAFAPLGTMPFTGLVPWFSDIVNVFHPIRALSHAAIGQGVLPVWNPQSACGLPFLADPNSAFWYPPNWVLDRMDPVLAMAADIVLHLFLAGALTYAAARVRGTSRIAATLAGTTFALCGVVFMQIQSPGNLRSLAWTPALLLGVSLLWRGRGRAGLLVTSFGWAMALLGGHQQFAVFAAPAVVAVSWGPPGEAMKRRVAVMALTGAAVVAGTLVAAVAILPAFEFLPLTQRVLGIAPERLEATAFAPGAMLHMLFGRPETGYSHPVGIVALLLGAGCVAVRRRGAAPLAVAAVFAAVMSLGEATPFGAVLQRVPPFAYFQIPARHIEAFELALVLLAAEGFDAWMRGAIAPRARWIIAAAAAALVAAAWLHAPGAISVRDVPRLAIAAGAIALFATGPARAATLRAAALVGLAAAEFLVTAGRFYWAPEHVAAPADARLPSAAIAAAPADARDGSYRVVTADRPWHAHNRTAVFGVDNVRAHVALTPMRLLDLVHIANEGTPLGRAPIDSPLYSYSVTPASPRLLDLFAVKYAVNFDTSPGAGWTNVGPGTWSRNCRMREAEFVPSVRTAGSSDEAAVLLAAPGFDAAATLVVESDGRIVPAPDAGGTLPHVRSIAHDWRGAQVAVDPGRAAWLIASWNRLPGLAAFADGAPIPTWPGDVAFTAVHVPCGTRLVEFRYEPPGLVAGAWISVAGLAACAAGAWICGRVTKHDSAPPGG